MRKLYVRTHAASSPSTLTKPWRPVALEISGDLRAVGDKVGDRRAVWDKVEVGKHGGRGSSKAQLGEMGEHGGRCSRGSKPQPLQVT